MTESVDVHRPPAGRGAPRSTHALEARPFPAVSTSLAQPGHRKRLTILLVALSLAALLTLGFSATLQPLPRGPLAAAGSCTSSGTLPNPNGNTVVSATSVWCDTSFKTYNITVGSASSYVSLAISNASLQLNGNWSVNSLANAFKAVNLTIDNSTIWFTRTASRLLVDFVGNSTSAIGSTILIKNSKIQGNVSNPDAFPLGLRVRSGWDGQSWYRLDKLEIWSTTFRNLGNYWTYDQAALDTETRWGWSKFAPGTFARDLNFTNPLGMNGSPPASNPWAVQVGDSFPIEDSSFYGGYMGASFSKYVYNNTFLGVCRDTYDPISYAVIRGNTYNATGQGVGCKDIDFFHPHITFTDNFLYNSGLNAGDGASGENYVGNSTFIGIGPRCNGYNVYNLTINNVTVYGDALDSRCNSPRVTNVRVSFPLLYGVGGYGGVILEPHPYDVPAHTPYQRAYAFNVSAADCSIYFGYLPWDNACFSLYDFNDSYVNYVNATPNQYPGQAVYLDNLTNTTVANVTVSRCDVCVYFGTTWNNSLVLDNVSFRQNPMRADYYVSRSGGITIKNQRNLAWTVLTGWYLGYLTWEWTNLLGNRTYEIQETVGSSVRNLEFNTTASGAGGVLIETPTNATASYSLLLIPVSAWQLLPPAQVRDLAAQPKGPGDWSLEWTAPGDHGMNGTAYLYEVRYSDQGPITDASWASASLYPQTWTPLPNGSLESRVITGFDPNMTYWVAIRAANEYLNWSPVSDNAVLSPQAFYASLVGLTVSPSAVTVPASGSVRFSSIAYDAGGSEFPVSPTWRASNGTVRPDGTFFPWAAGIWTVCADFGNLSDCAEVTVVPGPMVRLTARPASVELAVGQSAVLGAQAFDAKGNLLASVSLAWSVVPSSLGTIEAGNVFVARNVGSGTLQVNATSGGVTLASSIPVVVSSPSVLPGVLFPGDPLLMALLFTVTGGILIAVVYFMRRRARRRESSEPAGSPEEALVYQCGGCGAEVAADAATCPHCGSSFQG